MSIFKGVPVISLSFLSKARATGPNLSPSSQAAVSKIFKLYKFYQVYLIELLKNFPFALFKIKIIMEQLE
jgi:hypothetical protein